jgi:hypothetical protein
LYIQNVDFSQLKRRMAQRVRIRKERGGNSVWIQLIVNYSHSLLTRHQRVAKRATGQVVSTLPFYSKRWQTI